MKNTLRVRRAERAISQIDLARAAGIERNRYWTIEKGYTAPRPDERAALASALGVPESVIWPDNTQAQPAISGPRVALKAVAR